MNVKKPSSAKTMKYLVDVNIADDHTMFAESLSEAINSSGVAHVSRVFPDYETCRQTLGERCPDVLLLDVSMPDGSAVPFCQQMLAEHPKMRIICVTIHDEYTVIKRMIDIGIHGYLLKSAPVGELIEAIKTVWKGGTYVGQEVKDILGRTASEALFLSGVERTILRLICDGHTNPEIAQQISLSVETVNWYRKRLLAKCGVKNTVALVALTLREQLLFPEKE